MKYPLIIILWCSAFLVSAQTDSVLFLGNSYTAGNNLPALFDMLSKSAGDTFYVESMTQGGFTIQSHINNPSHLAKIQERAWKYFIVQEQSQVPTIDHYFNTLTLPALRVLESYAAQQNDCSKVLLFMTWGRRFGGQQCDQNNVHCSVNFNDFDHMQDTLKSRYIKMAKEIKGSTSPVGESWRIALADTSNLILHTGDNSHPNLMGSYLAACTHYASITGKSPVGISYTAGLNTNWANYLQRKAAEAVLDSMPVYQLDTSKYPEFNLQLQAGTLNLNTKNCKLDTLIAVLSGSYNGQNLLSDSIPLIFQTSTALGSLLKQDTFYLPSPSVCRSKSNFKIYKFPWSSQAYYLRYYYQIPSPNGSLTVIDTITALPNSFKILDSNSCFEEDFDKTKTYSSSVLRWGAEKDWLDNNGWDIAINADSILNQGSIGNSGAAIVQFSPPPANWILSSPCLQLRDGIYEIRFRHTNDRLDSSSAVSFRVIIDSSDVFSTPQLINDFGRRWDSTYQWFSDTFHISKAGNYYLGIETYSAQGRGILGIDDLRINMLGGQCNANVSLPEEHRKQELNLYPNPSKGLFMLSAEGFQLKPETVSIFSFNGQVVKAQIESINSSSLKVSGLKPGFYFVLWQNQVGETIKLKVIIN